MDGERLGVRLHPPKLGEHTVPLLRSIGYGDREIDELRRAAAIA
jgi:crotonobetainyl-CoA:carnitine CoA-transferase CaiB-like acyl-CoA transferase